jgi:hypothetical protein
LCSFLLFVVLLENGRTTGSRNKFKGKKDAFSSTTPTPTPQTTIQKLEVKDLKM